MFRFSCIALKNFMNIPDRAAAGTRAAEGSERPDDYTADWDRNWLVMAAALYTESLFKETGHKVEANVFDFWQQNCESPNLERSALPTATWRRDRQVYGVKDALQNEVPLTDYGPLRTYGSLRQLRDTVNAGLTKADFPEDYTNHHAGSCSGEDCHFTGDRSVKAQRSALALFRDRICNPTFKYGIEDAIGDPPYVTARDKITDASNRKKKSYDMYVPNSDLGPVDIKTRYHKGCGLGIDANSCDKLLSPNYEESSLWQWVYVTSSHIKEVNPGWHRLLHLPIFPDRACDANAKQICNSHATQVNENYDLDSAVAAQFKEEMKDAEGNLGMALLSVGMFAASMAMPGAGTLAANIGRSAARSAIRSQVGNAIIDGVQGSEILTGEELDKHKYFAAARVRRNLADAPGQRRLTYIGEDGTFNLDEMLRDGGPNSVLGPDSGLIWGLTRTEAAIKLQMIRQRIRPKFYTTMIHGEQAETTPTAFHTGKQALLSKRCSTFLRGKLSADDEVMAYLRSCEATSNPYKPYTSYTQYTCSASALELDDIRSVSFATEYLDRLASPGSPPPPPPSPEPPPPPSPPSPPPPPSPPVAISTGEGKALAFNMERAFCESVYLQSSEARCTALATSMFQRFVLDASFAPPSPAPLRPQSDLLASPPPPPSPPRPSLPTNESNRIVYYEPERVKLSTFFIAGHESDPSTASMEIGLNMPLSNLKNAARDDVLESITNRSLAPDQWVACSERMVANGAVLPCRTGDTPERCIDGFDRHCGTVESNTESPWLEIDMVDAFEQLTEDPNQPLRDYYFWGLAITLPDEEQFARLFWASANSNEDKDTAYTVTVYDETHNPLSTQCKPFYEQSVDFYTTGLVHFQYVCLGASAALETYALMRSVRYVRLTLRGSYRMIFIDRLKVIWRTITELPPSPPPSPAPPSPPPMPVAPPDAPSPPAAHTCAKYERKRLDAATLTDGLLLVYEEPCGLTFEQCCALAYEHDRTHAFQLSAAGCCTLLDVPSEDDRITMQPNGTNVPSLDFEFGDAATGVRDEDLNQSP
jgi:hypothetical protein